MKRRSFVKRVGKGLTSSMILPGITTRSEALSYNYPLARSLEDLMNDEKLVVIRLLMEGKSSQPGERLTGKIEIRNGKISRLRSYYTLHNNWVDDAKMTFNLSSNMKDKHVICGWLDDVSEASSVSVRIGKEKLDFLLSEIITQEEVVLENKMVKITINGLPSHEIGEIDPIRLGIKKDQNSFRFVIMADPQGGDPADPTNESPTRMKIHNAFIEESIEVANELDPPSLFTLILGDFTDSKGQSRNFNQMISFYEKLKQPILLEIGNHETRYDASFTPGYNMSEFSNYFAAQKKINELEKLLYSFDIGKWHFIVWPDPLRENFWDTHPHYFNWLERDLDKNRERPTFFFQHVPIHPVGINPLVSYVNQVHINRLLFKILSKYGNVKYVFSGHVHIPIKASNKTAVSYMGIRMINLPPTGYRTRAFGEEDYYGGPSQGICIVDVDDEKVDIGFQTVTRETFHYPQSFRIYSSDMDPLWFNYKWELKGNGEILNGSFEDGLEHWIQRYIYTEDSDPSNKIEVQKAPGRPGNVLYLFSRKRGYDAPGQDRLPQTLNQLTQIIQAPSEKIPSLRFAFRIDKSHFSPESWNGAFLWLEGYSAKQLNVSLVYVIGKGTYSIGGSYGRWVKSAFFDITDAPDQWHEAILNIGDDYRRSNGNRFLPELKIDKYAVNLGTWTINDGYRQEIGVFFDDVMVEFNYKDHTGESRLDDKAIHVMDPQKIFTSRIHHEAGEHRYGSQSDLYPY